MKTQFLGLQKGSQRPTGHPKQTGQYVSAKTRDCCFLLKGDNYTFCVGGKKMQLTLVLDVINQDETEVLFESPCKSIILDTVYVKSSMEKAKRCLLQHKDLTRKEVCLLYAKGFAVFPFSTIWKDDNYW